MDITPQKDAELYNDFVKGDITIPDNVNQALEGMQLAIE
jgi:hypothetical protein